MLTWPPQVMKGRCSLPPNPYLFPLNFVEVPDWREFWSFGLWRTWFFPGSADKCARHQAVGTEVSHLGVGGLVWRKLCFCVPACFCVDLSDDIPAVSVAFVTLEEREALPIPLIAVRQAAR